MEEGRAGGRGRSLVYRFYKGIILYIYFISHAKEREKERAIIIPLCCAIVSFFE